MLKTYIDSCVLIAAFKSEDPFHIHALDLIRDEKRQFFAGDLLNLETAAHNRARGYHDAADFYEAFLEAATKIVMCGEVTEKAIDLIKDVCLSTIDALHLASAICANVDEFITTEKNTKPLFHANVSPIIVRSVE